MPGAPAHRAGSPWLSIIVPTLNEEAFVGRCLDGLARPGVEVLVADGGSDDATTRLARAAGARVLDAPRGRAAQLAAGAAAAHGEVLLMLHADTRLPPDFDRHVRAALADPRIVGGAFRFALDARGVRFALVEALTAARCRLGGLPYGDQAPFVRAEVLAASGGVPRLPIMEDYVLMERLRARGRLALLEVAATTSARSWRRRGVARVALTHQAVLLGWRFGVEPARLAALRARWMGG